MTLWQKNKRTLHVTLSKIQDLNLDILVQTPGKFGSAQPMPQLMIPPRNHRPLLPLTTSGPPESPCKNIKGMNRTLKNVKNATKEFSFSDDNHDIARNE